MRRTGLVILISVFLCLNAWPEDIQSLSEVLAIGKGLLDKDGDGLADGSAFRISLPDHPTAFLTAAASAAASRINFESLVIDFELVGPHNTIEKTKSTFCPIFFAPEASRQFSPLSGISPAKSPPTRHQGRVSLVLHNGRPAITIKAGSPEALLSTGRAFFLRWPYLWDIWGRENGITYLTVENDLRQFSEAEQALPKRISTHTALYSFPDLGSPHEIVQKLRFARGQIDELRIQIEFAEPEARDRVYQALSRLQSDHRRGERTRVLNYPGCARLTIELSGPGKQQILSLDRIGFPRRFLTPGFRPRPRTSLPENRFDLPDFFTLGTAIGDDDADGIPDRIRSRVVVGPGTGGSGAHRLASRLLMHSSGAAFPLLYLDSEIENPIELDTPVLIGRDNRLIKKLTTNGKLRIPPLEAEQGLVQVVPRAFNKTDALAVLAADEAGLRSTLDYLSRTFPYLDNFSPGEPGLRDIRRIVEELFEGRGGAAEAYFSHRLDGILDKIEALKPESMSLRLLLPDPDPKFSDRLRGLVEKRLGIDSAEITSTSLQKGETIWKKPLQLKWEGDEALKTIEAALRRLGAPAEGISVQVGVSESPTVRSRLQTRIEELISARGMQPGRVSVLSAYKPGFFWIRETIIPRLKQIDPHRLLIRFAREEDDISRPKRFYSEPTRWLQELYPIDEIISGETGIPLDQIVFEMGPAEGPIYRVVAEDAAGRSLFMEDFSPRTREIDYLGIFPEWGRVRVGTGWVKVLQADRVLLDEPLLTDLERFWGFYQEQILPALQQHILKTTGGRPTLSKQPYFQRMTIDLELSEPDFRLDLDEEIVSSLEAIHDEIYFDTLDFLSGITGRDEKKNDDEPGMNGSRASAPGNILPLIHPSLEGKAGRVEVILEGAPARRPRMDIVWKTPEKSEKKQSIDFPEIEIKRLNIPSLIYSGGNSRIERLKVHAEPEREQDYLALIEIMEKHAELRAAGVLESPLSLPGIAGLSLELEHQDMFRIYDIAAGDVREASWPDADPASPAPGIVPTDRIISPEMCLELAERLSGHDGIRAYLAGQSYEKRPVPVLEVFSPLERHVAIPRLVTLKPTLYLSGRQHANEVSATNYILDFAEQLATEPSLRDLTRRVNIVCHPMENPDGAALAFRLQQLTPHHSLHAGRYSSLGIDVGSQVGSKRPLLPEARVRREISELWRPDIHLNLHGYPSHEWVQPFSGYSPFLFRDYWIPRGWFAYYRSVNLPIYEPFVTAGKELKEKIIAAMGGDQAVRDSNRRFYDRYRRWAGRWQPHMNRIEEYDGVNLYAARRSSREQKLSRSGRVTYIQETPELMDETARGSWLSFLCEQGGKYLLAHAEYLAQAEFDVSRIEEEFDRRIHIRWVRRRPARSRDGKNSR